MSDEPPSIREVLESLVAQAVGDGEAAEEELGRAYASALAQLTEAIHASVLEKHAEHLDEVRATDQGFRERNYRRWKGGFDMLAILRQTSIEAGQMFQQEFLRYSQFLHDPLLGVLMRLHAHACRVMGEVEALLLSGYPDGAHARWRTLHEIAVFSILIRQHGRPAAEDFVRYGLIEAVNGMEGYQATAAAMGRGPYAEEVLAPAIELRENLIAQCGEGIQSSNGWARKYIGSSKFPKLQEAAGLGKWANDYKAASRSIHFDYREMRSLLGMAEAKEDMLLCGQSNSGMTDPAHCSALTLVQTTGAFLNCYAEDQACPIDYSTSTVMVYLLSRMEKDVGERFLDVERGLTGADASTEDLLWPREAGGHSFE